MNAPALRFRIGEDVSLPETRRRGEWEKKQFSKAFSFLRNNTLSRDHLSLSIGSVKNIHYGDILVVFPSLVDPGAPIVPFVADERDVKGQTRLRSGDVVIADTAEDETVGRVVEIIGDDSLDTVAGLHTMPCRPADAFASGFLGYSLNSHGFHDQLLPLIQGSKVSSISKGAIGDVFIRYPAALPEQQAISSFFHSLDTLIDVHEKALGKLEALKKAMLQKMFPQGHAKTPEVRFKGFEGEWEEKRLGEMNSRWFKGQAFSKCQIADQGKYKCIHYGELFTLYGAVVNNVVSTTDVKPMVASKVGDILFPASDVTPDGLGRCTTLLEDGVLLGGDIIGLRQSTCDPAFLSYAVNNAKQQIIRLASGTTVRHSSAVRMASVSISYPTSPLEQQKIGQFFRSLDALLAARREEVGKLRDLKKALLERMFI